jgi:hypothetical protein
VKRNGPRPTRNRFAEFFSHDGAEISKPGRRFLTFECGADKSQAIGSHPWCMKEATLTGFEPTLNFSRLCAIPSQICARLRVRGGNANQGVCMNRAELRGPSVRICPTTFSCLNSLACARVYRQTNLHAPDSTDRQIPPSCATIGVPCYKRVIFLSLE